MKVLIACEESQTVCKAFREKGHEAYSCDIQECSGGHPEWHIKGDVLPLLKTKTKINPLITLNGNVSYVTQGIWFTTCDDIEHYVEKWDLIIAHPPCTYLTNAGARWLWAGGVLNEERYQKGIAAKEFFKCFLNANCDKIVIENPVPSAVYDLPKYTQIIQPYEHGHPHTKKTCLWLKGLPELKPTNIVEPIKGKRFQQKNGKWRYSCWEMEQGGSKVRSKTFEGIAKAMAEQWG